jgi:hypothetical protein
VVAVVVMELVLVRQALQIMLLVLLIQGAVVEAVEMLIQVAQAVLAS